MIFRVVLGEWEGADVSTMLGQLTGCRKKGKEGIWGQGQFLEKESVPRCQ